MGVRTPMISMYPLPDVVNAVSLQQYRIFALFHVYTAKVGIILD